MRHAARHDRKAERRLRKRWVSFAEVCLPFLPQFWLSKHRRVAVNARCRDEVRHECA